MLNALLGSLGLGGEIAPPGMAPMAAQLPDSLARMGRQVAELVEHTQRVMRDAPLRRREFWAKADPTSLASWAATTEWYRDYFHKEVIGELPHPPCR